ncbi:MAG: hypothetical protein IAX21_10005 [Candidatus Bathyarchaeota archaeon]|nr:hypothetical protein [Candidatus Bathyarchaeum tardum]WGM88799.1 MAG: hypothetical protein NUK63_07705 [Candidatus Bathyarchaeum tardum]WNZ28955.1 MAG: hypothetical protein IAX21_10005 [Candidatus Bathyarchaeota archaeon]
MDSSYFVFLVLPLAVIVFFLVGLTLYYARKGEDEYEKEIKKLRKLLISGKINTQTFNKLKSKTDYVKDYNNESKRLLELLSSEKIDDDTYNRLNQVLEKSFQEKISRLEDETEELDGKPFHAAKF